MQRNISISVGELWGIGPELILRTLAETSAAEGISYTVHAPRALMALLAERDHLAEYWAACQDLPHIRWQASGFEKSATAGGAAALSLPEESDQLGRARITQTSLNAAIEACLKGESQALLTAPLDKAIMQKIDPHFVGHTEYLQQQAEVSKTLMLLDNGELRVGLLTNHVDLDQVSALITAENIMQCLSVAREAWPRHFPGEPFKAAVCGLNPHAGELSPSSKENTVMQPTLKKLRDGGMDVEGPFSADGLFPQARASKKWTMILACYHDQGLVAAKYSGLDKVVNITLGLPFVRVSPGHGVAYDLRGKRAANLKSFKRALMIARARQGEKHESN